MSGVTDLTYKPFQGAESPPASPTKVALFDLTRGMSIMNAKNYEYTDRKGNLQGVICDITLQSNNAITANVYAAMNSWKVRNAVRKFHFLRDDMFRRAGVTKKERGKYGQTMRPLFDLCHSNDYSGASGATFNYWQGNPQIVGPDCPSITTTGEYLSIQARGGEWTYSTLVAADPTPDATGPEAESADEWLIHLCDGHDTPEVPWGSVGMVTAYNQDRMEVVTPVAGDDTTIVPNNPLSLLKSQSVTGGEVADVAEDQELETPPYDRADDGDSARKHRVGELRCVPHLNAAGVSTPAISTLRNVFLPAGYCALQFSKVLFPGSGEDSFLDVRFDVHGIVDCKDWHEA